MRSGRLAGLIWGMGWPDPDVLLLQVIKHLQKSSEFSCDTWSCRRVVDGKQYLFLILSLLDSEIGCPECADSLDYSPFPCQLY